MTTQHRWLPQSPQQIRTRTFDPPRRARRGYHAEQVDAYLDQLAADAGHATEIITWLRGELERVKDYLRNSDLSPAQLQTQHAHTEAVTLLSRAQQQADQLIAAAQEQARRIVGDAAGQRDQMLQDAQQQAEQAARHYREGAGAQYSPQVEQAVRQVTLLRTLTAAINTVRTQLPAILQQLDAVSGVFDHELATIEDHLTHARQIAATGTAALPHVPQQPATDHW